MELQPWKSYNAIRFEMAILQEPLKTWSTGAKAPHHDEKATICDSADLPLFMFGALTMPEGHKLDCDKIDDCVLALLALGLHDHNKAWKGFDWGVMRRLHAKGLIGNPVGRNKSVTLTDQGLRKSQTLLRAFFQENPNPQ